MCISLGFCGVSSTVTTMGLGLGVWRIDDRLEEVELGEMPSEEQLEELLHKNPSILGEPLLIVGRQVGTSTGKRIDLLAIDSEGVLRVLELKKGRAPRDAVAQVLEYGAWVQTLSHDNVLNIFAQKNLVPFEEAFEDTFGFAPPEELNTGHVNGQSKLPTGGQQKCPLVATKTAHTRPTDLPTWGLVALAVRGVLV